MERSAAAASALAVALDQADIRPLDLQGALQILVAEVRLSLVEALIDPVDGSNVSGRDLGNAIADNVDHANAFLANTPAESLSGPVPAARVIMDLVLRSLPEAFEPTSWAAMLPRVDLATQAGVQRALDAVSTWRDVPPAAVEAAKASATLALSLIADEQPYPLWPPDEWIGFAPRLGRFWRRRRALKRRLLDPDHGIADPDARAKWDDLDELC